MLKFRLPIDLDEDYLNFVRKNLQPGEDPHHFSQGYRGTKHNHYTVYPIKHDKHNDVHQRGIEDQEEAVLQIIASLINYIKHLKGEKPMEVK